MNNQLTRYEARALAKLTREQLWNLPEGPHIVVFDDGELEAIREETIVSAHMWDLYNYFPQMPTSVKHHLGDEVVGMSTHLDLMAEVRRSALPFFDHNRNEEVCRIIYQSVNDYYNTFIVMTTNEANTLSILDFIELLDNPRIIAAKAEVKPNKLSIEQCYRKIEAVLRDPAELLENAVANAVRNGMVSVGQVLQCIAPRGFVTDADSNIFPHPVMTGSVEGYRLLRDSMQESRSATKSLSFTDEPLQFTEFMNRRLQLLASTLSTLWWGDCGSTRYSEILIKNRTDLRDFAGKYYFDGKHLKAIGKRDDYLVGQVLKIRTLYSCDHMNSQAKCSTCYGEMAFSIMDGTNIGHVAATALGEKISQKVLSLKHEDKTASGGGIDLSPYDLSFVNFGSEPNELKLNPRLEGKKIRLIMDSKQAEHLTDVTRVKSVEELPVEFVSKLSQVIMEIDINEEGFAAETALVQVSNGDRHSSISHAFMRYIASKGFDVRQESAQSGCYVVDLSDWDIDETLFVLPMRHVNMLDYAKNVDRFIKSSDVEKRKEEENESSRVAIETQKRRGRTWTCLRDFKTYESALSAFHDLVSSELVVNIVHLEVLISSCMVRSIANRDYRLPLPGNQLQFGNYTSLMSRRSLSNKMVHQDQKRVLAAPSTYLIERRPDGSMDELFYRYGDF